MKQFFHQTNISSAIPIIRFIKKGMKVLLEAFLDLAMVYKITQLKKLTTG